MKKRLLSVVMAAAVTASLTACGGSNQAETTAAATTAAETTAAKAEEPKAADESQAVETEAPGAELPSFEGQQLRVSTFSFNAELLQKNVYDPFMEATGCELIDRKSVV